MHPLPPLVWVRGILHEMQGRGKERHLLRAELLDTIQRALREALGRMDVPCKRIVARTEKICTIEVQETFKQEKRMKKDIKQEIKKHLYTNAFVVDPNNPGFVDRFIEHTKAAVWGADWRINSVWHDASERPEKKHASCLVEVKEGDFSFFLVSEFYQSGGFSFMDGICNLILKRWAYIKDLTPNTEE